MTNQERILSNNNLIDQAIAKANSLPNAGSGSYLPSASKKEVNFYDYDGTILYSYTVAEAQALTSLPALPSHEGLICQGWNYDLATIKSYNRAVDVGAMYTTDDGKTRIYIHLEEGRTSPMLGCCPNGTVTVDWGDGSTSTLTGTSTSIVKWTSNHNYANAGDYVITLAVSGSMGFYGDASSNQGSGILRYSSSSDNRNYVYRNAIQKIEIGNGVISIIDSAFYGCHSLASITIPNSVTSIGKYAFYECVSLASITIPNGVMDIGDSTFYYCYTLVSIAIPTSITSIGGSAFTNCRSLASIAIPNGVTSIGSIVFSLNYSLTSVSMSNRVTSIANLTFNNCYGMVAYDFTTCTSVPTLANTKAFSNIPSDCKIKVPASLYNEWIAATNWSTYANQIVAV